MYILKDRATECEALLLTEVFEHLKKYRDRARANGSSVADELNNASSKDIGAYMRGLRDAVANLSNCECDIIERLYGFSPRTKGLTREEVARDYGVTRERIRQVEARALQKIKRYSTEFTDEERQSLISILKIEKGNQIVHANRAEEQGNHVSMEVYMHNWSVCDNAENKLKIQQDICKWQKRGV